MSHKIKDDSDQGHNNFLIFYNIYIVLIYIVIFLFYWKITESFNDFSNWVFTLITLLFVTGGYCIVYFKLNAKKIWLVITIPLTCLNVAWFVFSKPFLAMISKKSNNNEDKSTSEDTSEDTSNNNADDATTSNP